MIDFTSFIDYLRYEKRVSPHTITAYESDLGQFSRYMEEVLQIGTLAEVTAGDIRTWVITLLEDEKDTARTVNRKLSALKAFYRHGVKVGTIAQNPMHHVRSPKFQKRLPEYVEQRDMARLFDDIEFEEGYEGTRDRLILELWMENKASLEQKINVMKNHKIAGRCNADFCHRSAVR